jgi:hypothetical protein
MWGEDGNDVRLSKLSNCGSLGALVSVTFVTGIVAKRLTQPHGVVIPAWMGMRYESGRWKEGSQASEPEFRHYFGYLWKSINEVFFFSVGTAGTKVQLH